MENIENLLKELTSAVGVSGEEENIVKLLTEKLEAYGDVSVDNMNNVYCTFGEGYHFLLDAHLDEIGMIVTDITDDGFIKVNRTCNISIYHITNRRICKVLMMKRKFPNLKIFQLMWE